MKTGHPDDDTSADVQIISSIKQPNRRTLETIFRHPAAHNLEWRDVLGLIGEIGEAHDKANREVLFEVAGRRHLMHRPHTKDLTTSEVIEVRRFLMQSGFSPELPSKPPKLPSDPPGPSLLIVMDHHGAKIFHVDVTSDDASEHVIRPSDPHHFLHHLVHRDQSRQQGQRAPEDAAYYAKIAEAVALGGKIVIVGHGVGKSNAAHHLTEYLQSDHPQTYQRIVRELVADLSGITTPQLLDQARQALRE